MVELVEGDRAVAVLVVVAEEAEQQLRRGRVALAHRRACLAKEWGNVPNVPNAPCLRTSVLTSSSLVRARELGLGHGATART